MPYLSACGQATDLFTLSNAQKSGLKVYTIRILHAKASKTDDATLCILQLIICLLLHTLCRPPICDSWAALQVHIHVYVLLWHLPIVVSSLQKTKTVL